jgi:hypothetical protein
MKLSNADLSCRSYFLVFSSGGPLIPHYMVRTFYVDSSMDLRLDDLCHGELPDRGGVRDVWAPSSGAKFRLSSFNSLLFNSKYISYMNANL